MQTIRSLILVFILTCFISRTLAAKKKIQLLDGKEVTTTKSTMFLGTEYDPKKCVLQFGSKYCEPKDPSEEGFVESQCGLLNEYALECVKLGRENGEEKRVCRCLEDDIEVCQNTTLTGGVPQFGDCSNDVCADTYGHQSTKVESRICAEKIHCVEEINTTATIPAKICHTCRSCIAQNSDDALTDVKRFDCTKICPEEILKTLDLRNKLQLGIADKFPEEPESDEGDLSGSDDYGTSEAEEASDAGSSASTSDAKEYVFSSALLRFITAIGVLVAMQGMC